MYNEETVVEEINEAIKLNKLNDNLIYIIPTDEDKMIKIFFENERPCPVACQLGFNRHCKHAKVTIKELELDIRCSNIGCEECFLKERN